jgi:nucleotide-binding universal stress UspA family protein
MFKTIVLGLDGSDDAQAALPVAVDLARRYDSVLLVVHVEEVVVGKGGAAPLHAGEDEFLERLRKQVDELSNDGVTAKLEVAESVLGGPAPVIEQIADRMKAELIVVGRRGRSEIADLVLGSVTHRLLHVAKRPVLAVPVAS